ncbi:MAG TPA: S41 family peptidase [bacterium]|nr:S41 family peptidase [bacterium]
MKTRTRVLAVVLLAGVALGVYNSLAEAGTGSFYQYLRLFNEVLKKVQDTYVDETAVTPEKLMVGAINGMLATLGDPYTRLISPTNYEEVREDSVGEFGGLGIVVTMRDDEITIVSPMAGTPAFKVGLRPGDRIVEIDGVSTTGMELNDAVKRMRGRPGTTVNLLIHRTGAADFPVTVERANIKHHTVEWQDLGEGIGYIRLNQFNEHAGIDIRDALAELPQGSQLKGLIFDLRNNPGGLYEEAGIVVDVFMDSGLVVYTKGRDQVRRREIYCRNDGNEPRVPLVLLVNGGSASAAEIVTGAMKDNGRATVIGTRTFGKGIVQSVTNVSLGYGLSITTERYYTPSGVCIDKQGIEPHYTVTADDIADTYVRALVKINSSDTFISYVNRLSGFSEVAVIELRDLLRRDGVELPDRLLRWTLRNQLAVKEGRAFVGDLESDRQLRVAHDFLLGRPPVNETDTVPVNN